MCLIQYKRASTNEELKEILTLQNQNLSPNISETDQQKEGFVTVQHDFEL